MVTRTQADVVIMGAGAAGSLIAATLARAGRKVMLLDAGPGWRLADLASSQIWARRLKWGGPPVEYRGDREGLAINLNTGWGLGGAALHHYATWPRLNPEAFATRRLYGVGVDWPIGYDDLRPFYDRIQTDVGIAGDAAAERWRPPGEPYPLPPLPTFAQGELLGAGFAKLGLPVAPLPAAILTQEYKGRPACVYDGWCDAGCPTGALANPLATYQAEAIQLGAEVRAGMTVTRILPDGARRAAGVLCRDKNGDEHRIDAGEVVLAGSVIQNPRLMLASACDAWPAGAGNQTDQVGRNLTSEGMALVYGLFDQPTDVHLGVSCGQLMNRARHEGDRPAGKPFGAYQWQIAPSMKPHDIFGVSTTRPEIFGTDLHAFIRRASRHIASMAAMIEAVPDPENRIILSARTDRHGVPLPLASHRFAEETRTLWRYCVSEGEAVMTAAGAREHWAAPMQPGHLIGGTLMGDDPATSVADRWGRVHDIANLHLAGSGLFPTSGGVSPTFTLMALALRTAERIARG